MINERFLQSDLEGVRHLRQNVSSRERNVLILLGP